METSFVSIADFRHRLNVDDRTAMHAQELERVEPSLQRCQRRSHEMAAAARVDPHVVVLGLDPNELCGLDDDGSVALPE